MGLAPNIIYLHGFASGPSSSTARFLRDHLASWSIPLHVPDLNVPTFEHLSLTEMIETVAQVVSLCPPGPTFVIASSFGALVALHYLDQARREGNRISGAVFLAPAFDFIQNRQREFGTSGLKEWQCSGSRLFYHHSYHQWLPVSFALVEELMRYDSYATSADTPILIFHGCQDEVVDCHQSARYARSRSQVTLRILECGHSFASQLNYIWTEILHFVGLCDLSQLAAETEIQLYDLRYPADVSRFMQVAREFGEILDMAYEERSIGSEQHIARALRGRCSVFMAFGTSPARRAVGCSYLRYDGKRSATAVIPAMRRRGVARRLLCSSMKQFTHQFTEIRVADLAMRHLLEEFGFTYIGSPSSLRSRLGDTQSLIQSIDQESRPMRYRRRSALRPDVINDFVMLEYDGDRFDDLKAVPHD